MNEQSPLDRLIAVSAILALPAGPLIGYAIGGPCVGLMGLIVGFYLLICAGTYLHDRNPKGHR
jgi:hypothetical protein